MRPETRSYYEDAVEGAVRQIEDSLDEALDLETLARQAALSPFHFHRIFRGMLGETPLELHRRLRMERAARRLVEGDAPVTETAFDAGYETHEAFTRAFRDRYGVPPSEFRARARRPEGCGGPDRYELAAPSGLHFQVPGSSRQSIHFMRGGEAMDVQVRDLPGFRTSAVRHVGPYNRISQAFARLGAVAGPAGLITGGPMLGLYHDDPEATPEAELRSDAALVVADEATIPPELTELRIPAGRYAMAIHRGAYTGLGDAWARLMGRWLPDSGERVGEGVSFEIYRNTPDQVPEEELETELYVPLASGSA